MRSWNFFFACNVMFALLSFVGCKETSESNDSEATINLYSPPDTIRCVVWDPLPHFPIEVPMIAEVLSDGHPVAGVPISIDLRAAHGQVVYEDSLLQCTTRVDGRVEFTYVTGCHGGCDTIVVTALEHSASAAVPFDTDTMYSINLQVSDDTLHVPIGSEDSTEVSIRLKTGLGIDVSDSIVTLTASGGRLDFLPPTDYMGMTQTWWHSNYEYGLFTLVASFSKDADTARILVDALAR